LSLSISACEDKNATLILANLKEKRISLMSGNDTTLPFGPIRANDRSG
jgi:hypothetical protein